MTDISKLPKWAQQRINHAEMRLREAEEKLAALIVSDPDAPILADPYGDKRALPPNDVVQFTLKNGAKIHVSRDICNGGDGSELRLNVTDYGWPRGEFCVVPWASNVLSVSIRPRLP